MGRRRAMTGFWFYLVCQEEPLHTTKELLLPLKVISINVI